MSTLTVTTINTANGSTDLTFGTGNTSGGKITIPASGASMYFTGGFKVTSNNAGIVTSGTVTLNEANGNYQYLTANGAFTLNAPTNDCAIDLLITNGSAAGTITLTGVGSNATNGWTANSTNAGDTYATTNGNRYLFMTRKINGVATYMWKALQ